VLSVWKKSASSDLPSRPPNRKRKPRNAKLCLLSVRKRRTATMMMKMTVVRTSLDQRKVVLDLESPVPNLLRERARVDLSDRVPQRAANLLLALMRITLMMDLRMMARVAMKSTMEALVIYLVSLP